MSTETHDPPIEVSSGGAGTMAAGIGPAGLYSPASVAASPQPSAGSRYINPATRDYQIADVTGQMAQMPKARQAVLIAMMTLRGSSTAVPRFGLNAPRKMGSRFVSEMRAAVRSALSHLTQENNPVIRIVRIDVDVPKPGRTTVTVAFIDLSTGSPDLQSAFF